jgi:hypothetical protein
MGRGRRIEWVAILTEKINMKKKEQTTINNQCHASYNNKGIFPFAL